MVSSGDRTLQIGGSAENSPIIQGDHNVVRQTIHQHIYGSEPGAAPARRKSIPPLLPYLVDRQRQERCVEQVLRDNGNGRRQLHVFVLYGDERQCHDMLLRRFEQKVLPTCLGKNVQRYDIPWPEDLDNTQELPRELLRNLTRQLSGSGHSLTNQQEINGWLKEHPAPVMLASHLLGEEWQKVSETAIHGFFEFWDQWPDLAPGQSLLVFLSVKFEWMAEHSGRLGRLLGRWFGSRSNRVGAAIEEQLRKLDVQRYPRLRLTLLPQLDGVDRSEAENWARSRELERFVAREVLLRHIEDLYRDWRLKTDSSTMPMEQLADHLMGILESV